MSRFANLCLPALLLVISPPLFADDRETLFNKVSLQAEIEREVPNDEMTVVLAVEHQGSAPAALADRVNKDTAWALEQVKAETAIKSKTRAYSTHPIYRDRVITGWRVRQELELKSQDFPAMTELVGKLQERLQVAQMGFSPTPETRRQHQNELISEAMEQFKERVGIVQKHMDGRDYRIVELDVNTSGFGIRPMMAADYARTAAPEMAAPAVEAGTSQVQVTITGSVQFY
jgi:predicted secreted protein